MTNNCTKVTGMYESLGSHKIVGDCAAVENIVIGNQNLQNVIIMRDTLSLFELGDILTVTYFELKGTKYISYAKFDNGNITNTPNFATRVMVNMGTKTLGILLLAYFGLMFLSPSIITTINAYGIAIPAVIALSMVSPALIFGAVRAKVLACKNKILTA